MRRMGRGTPGWLAALLMLATSSAFAADARQGLLEAVKKGDTAAVRAFLKGGDSNVSDADGTTALHWAADGSDLETVDLLLQAGARVDALNWYRVTPLLLASSNGNAAIVERLLKAGADANVAFPQGDTALMAAARAGHVAALKTLVAYGANVHARTRQGQTALMWAAAENNADAVQTLIEAGADIHARSAGERGFTAMLLAVRAGGIETARVLLGAGADVNETFRTGPSAGMSTLVLAVVNARYDLAVFLMEHGADPNDAVQGWTALHQQARRQEQARMDAVANRRGRRRSIWSQAPVGNVDPASGHDERAWDVDRRAGREPSGAESFAAGRRRVAGQASAGALDDRCAGTCGLIRQRRPACATSTPR